MLKDGLLSPKEFCRAIAVGLLLLTVGCNASNGWAMNRSGMKQYQRGNFAQARHQFARAIASDPRNPDFRHNLAMSIQKQGDPVAAETILRHNLTIDAMHQPTYHSLAQVLTGMGRVPEAIDLVAGWAVTQPYVAEANLELAWLQREVGSIADAEQALMNALRADPTHPTALAHLGQLYQESGRTDQAVAYYQRSLASKWDQPEVQSRLATLVEPESAGRRATRSALLQNSGSGQMLAMGPMSPSMGSMSLYGNEQQAIALEDLPSNPKPRRVSRRGIQDGSIIAAYPLPNFDSPTSAWAPTGTYSSQPMTAFQSPDITGQPMAAPQMADSGYSPTPIAASGPILIPQADPAHFPGSAPELTASLPVVDPH